MTDSQVDTLQFPGHLIRRLHQISVALFADHMARNAIDLTPVQFAAIEAVAHQPGVDQATIAARIAYDRATLGKVIDRLESKALIRRSVSPTDRRARVVTLTDEGHALLIEALPIVQALQAEILTGLTPAEQAQMTSLLTKVTQLSGGLRRAPHRAPTVPQRTDG
ncbi:MarR family winged helix-turn-helix transcriptional regulator [Phaeobacter porticola]|uniref:Transcriptional regulator, MarR family n=1 Tax=Phaeobacter porticola TaxID=1844006 RepID=A0A1L3I3E0_9RHOB|nr:MarR family transcriptional regulator [Phaeobacter porticola]APG46640.1 transcriptional regulator, MarR family [Phaeobacter porticola]